MSASSVWNWQSKDGLPYLTCSLLEPWPHGFFTQQFWPQSPAELTGLLEPQATAYRAKQVHGNTVLAPTEVSLTARTEDESTETPELPQADGWITDRSTQAVWVCTADCTPVLIADEGTGHVAAIHAGWRGTAAKIVPAAIARLQAQGSRLEQLKIALGPAISGEVYQVAETVALEVGATIAQPELLQGQDVLLQTLQSLAAPPVLKDQEPGKARLDVRRVIALQLEQMGIAAEQVAIAPHCTYQQPEYFFSYRRTGQKQVQWSGIVSKDGTTLMA